MSDFLNDVMNNRSIITTYRADNHLICTMEREGRRMNFLATDENDWHGVLMAQYQEPLTEQQSDGVQYFLRSIDPMPLPMLLRLEYHDITREVRAVMRWPLHEGYCPCDDAKLAVEILFDCWTTVEPFIRRASEGEDIAALVAEANRRLDALFPKRHQQSAA